jgi:hypothetical protein
MIVGTQLTLLNLTLCNVRVGLWFCAKHSRAINHVWHLRANVWSKPELWSAPSSWAWCLLNSSSTVQTEVASPLQDSSAQALLGSNAELSFFHTSRTVATRSRCLQTLLMFRRHHFLTKPMYPKRTASMMRISHRFDVKSCPGFDYTYRQLSVICLWLRCIQFWW